MMQKWAVSRGNKKKENGLLSAALLGAFAVFCMGAPALAQNADEAFDGEFSAFKKKVEEARLAEASGLGEDDIGVDDDEEDDADVAIGANPLGAAAALPVKGKALSTVGALAPTSPAALQAQLEAEAATLKEKAKQETFDRALRLLMPLEPEAVREVYERFRESREAAETPIKIPKVKTQIQTITLDPGQSAPVIHMVPGYVTTLSILDSSGAPWPIQDLTFAGKFNITPPETGGHIIRMTPNSAHGVGNMSMRLVDLVTPVIFTLQTSLDTVDYRIDARLTRPGPLAKTPIIEYGGLHTVAGTDAMLAAILNGTVPASAEKLRMTGVDGRTSAWRVNNTVYLRTSLSLLSPAWNSSVASGDGTTVYTLNNAPVILLSDKGRMVRAHITGDSGVVQ